MIITVMAAFDELENQRSGIKLAKQKGNIGEG
jgi:hypothetical protein